MRLNIQANLKRLTQELEKSEKKTQQALTATISDMRTRIPSIVAKSVRSEYNVKQKEAKPSKIVRMKGQGIKIKGYTVADYSFKYFGYRRTVADFGMLPRKPPKRQEKAFRRLPGINVGMGENPVAMGRPIVPYDVSVMIKKGQRRKLAGNVFIGTNTHGKQGVNKQKYIPFIREPGAKRNKIKSIQTISVPEMIRSMDVSNEINTGTNELLEKRLEHNLNRFFK